MRISFMLVVVALCCLSSSAMAQSTAQGTSSSDTSSKAQAPQISRVTLKDGQTLRGVVSLQGDLVVVTLTTGQEIKVPAAAVVRIKKEDPDTKGMTHRTRYLYSPSAMMLKKGEGYISQKELLFTSFAFGITDWLTVVAGGALPFWFIEDGFNLIGGVKLGGQLADQFHVSMGAEAIAIPGVMDGKDDPAFAGLLFGTVTLGDATRHVSINAGMPFSSSSVYELPIVSVSGYYQFNSMVGILSENWLIIDPDDDDVTTLLSLALRFTPGDFSIDAGAIFAGVGIPIPWVDFSWSFGS